MPPTSVCLICLVGLPASGKSTLARDIKTRFQMKFNVDIVSFDQEISWDDSISWKDKRSSVHDSVKCLIQKYLTIPDKQTLIVLDDNMYYRSMRYEYFKLARMYGIGFCEIYLSSPLAICLKLNSQRVNPVAKSTIEKMNALLEVPDSSANTWEKNIAIIPNYSLSSDTWLNLEKVVCDCLLTPVKEIDRSLKEALVPSTLHVVDIALRKVVNALIIHRKENYGDPKLYSLELVRKRQQVLHSVRTGEIILPKTNKEDCIQLYSEYLQQYF